MNNTPKQRLQQLFDRILSKQGGLAGAFLPVFKAQLKNVTDEQVLHACSKVKQYLYYIETGDIKEMI